MSTFALIESKPVDRFSWTPADQEARAWFLSEASSRGMTIETDGNGNLWSFRGDPLADRIVVTGSHLDSVPGGGGFDGPLGVASAFAALDRIDESTLPIAVTAFVEEEGARFGVACLGSRLMTGLIDPNQAARLRDAEGITWSEAMARAGERTDRLGADPDRVSRIACFVELHIEQGRALDLIDRPLGIATEIWPHGRWRIELEGEGNHAGTTRMEDRNDPMTRLAGIITAVTESAIQSGGRATIGKVTVNPNGVNAIASRVTAWLDVRAPTEMVMRMIVAAAGAGIEESFTPAVLFDPDLQSQIKSTVEGAEAIPTAAGHDAGILQLAGVPSAMLFVRNRTGVSHSRSEHAASSDIEAGVAALAAVLDRLANP